MKQTGKERRQAGRDHLKESYVKCKEANNETERGKEFTKEVKKVCKELGRSKKASKSGSKMSHYAFDPHCGKRLSLHLN